MSTGNPVNFSDMFDFSDNGPIRKAISDIASLRDAYEQFTKVVTGGVLTSFNAQQQELAKTARDLATATRELNITSADSQKQLLKNAQTMTDLESKLKSVQAAQQAAKSLFTGVADSVDGLTARLKEQINQYNALSRSQDSVKMKDLAATIRGTRDELNQLTNAMKISSSSTQAAQGSYAALDAETKRMVADLKQMENGMNSDNVAASALAKQIYDNTSKLKEFDKTINQNFRNVGNYGSAFAGLNGVLVQLGITFLTLQGLVQGVQTTFEKTMKFDALNTTISLVSGNSVEGAKNLEFLRKTADKLKLDITGVTEGFRLFAASTYDTKFQGQKTRDIFYAVSEAANVMHLSVDQTQNVFLALGHMMSKGSIQAQDLRMRLGNNLSGAFNLFAKGIGVTSQELAKMMHAGKLTSDMLIPFAEQLHKSFGPQTQEAVHSLQARVNDFNNTINEGIVDGNFVGFFKDIVDMSKGFVVSLINSVKWMKEHRNATIIMATGLALLNTASIEATGAWIANTAALIYNSVVTKAKAAADAVATVAAAAYWSTIGVLTGEITMATAAQEVWNAVMVTSPVGALVLLIGALALVVSAYSDNTREVIELEKEKAALTARYNDIIEKNANIQKDINAGIDNWVNLSQQQREELEKTIVLRKQELELMKAKLLAQQKEVGNKAAPVTFWQKFKGDLAVPSMQEGETYQEFQARVVAKQKQVEDKNRNAATEEYAQKLQDVNKELETYDDELKSVTDITHAYERAMSTSTVTIEGLNKKERFLRLSLRNSAEGTTEYKNALVELGHVMAELDRRDPDKIIAAEKRDENKKPKKQKDPELLLKQQQDLLSQAVIAQASYETSIADLEYAQGEQSYQDKVELEQKKLDILEDSYAKRLKIYFADNDAYLAASKSENKYDKERAIEYQKILTERNVAEKKELDDIEKAKKEKAAADKKREEEAAKLVRQNIALSRQERDKAVEEEKGKLKLQVINKQITQGDADKKFHEFRKTQLQEEIDDQVEALATMNENDASYFDKKKQLNDLEKQLISDKYDYEIKKAEETKRQKEALEQAWINFAEQGASAIFTISADSSDAKISKLEDEKDKEIEIAGDNANAKKAIEEKYQKLIAKEKRKAAITEKIGAVFQIGVSTAVAIMKAFADFPYPVALGISAALGATGLLEAAAVIAKPIPSYAVGRNNGPSEIAEVNEKGPELIVKGNKWRIAGGGERTLTKLEAGDKVITAENTVKMIYSQFADNNNTEQMISSLLKGTGVVMSRESAFNNRLVSAITSSGFNPEKMSQLLMQSMAKLPFTEIVLDENGFNTFSRSKNGRINNLNGRQRIGGKG